MIIDTKAVKITKETYPIAVACLAAGFATQSFEKVKNHYLVINELEGKYFSKDERPILAVGNCWMGEKHFRETYKFVTKEITDKFVSVKKI